MRIIMKTCFRVMFIPLLMATALPVFAQTEGPGWVRLERTKEIQLARSAAPASVSADATIWLLDNDSGTYQAGISGSNGNHCLVMRSYPNSVEPLCYDAEASRTILPIELKRFEMRTAGQTWAEIDAAIEKMIEEGLLEAPSRPAMSYMLSSAQVLYADDGRHVGPWKPHIMYYVPYVTNEQIGLVAGPSPEIVVSDPGTAVAHVVVVVPSWVDPE